MKIASCHSTDYKPVKQEVKGTVILPPLVFPSSTNDKHYSLLTKATKKCLTTSAAERQSRRQVLRADGLAAVLDLPEQEPRRDRIRNRDRFRGRPESFEPDFVDHESESSGRAEIFRLDGGVDGVDVAEADAEVVSGHVADVLHVVEGPML